MIERDRHHRIRLPCTSEDTSTMFRVHSEQCYMWSPNIANPNATFRPITANYQRLERETQYRRQSSSMLWDRPSHTIMTLDEDCTSATFSVTSADWFPLSFNQMHPPTGGCISRVGHGNGDTCIGAPGPTRWNSLLPDSALREPDYEGLEPGDPVLAGDLTLLLGLIAFSAQDNYAIAALNDSWTPGHPWMPHDYGVEMDQRHQR